MLSSTYFLIERVLMQQRFCLTVQSVVSKS